MEEKNTQSNADQYASCFAQVEYALSHYYDAHIKGKIEDYLKEIEKEKLEHIKAMTPSHPFVVPGGYGATAQAVQMKQHLSMYETPRNVEELRDECIKRLGKDDCLGKDLSVMVNHWREIAILQLGVEKYKELSEQLPQKDLAAAYMERQLTKMFCAQLAEKEVPKSTLEYVIYKGIHCSAIGDLLDLSKDAGMLDNEVVRLAKEKYDPSFMEDIAGSALGVGIDLLSVFSLGPMSKTTILTTSGLSLASDFFDSSLDGVEEKELSKILYGDKTKSKQIHQLAGHLESDKIPVVRSINAELSNRLELPSIPYDTKAVESVAHKISVQTAGSGSKMLDSITEYYKDLGIKIKPSSCPEWVENLDEETCYRKSADYFSKAVEMRCHYRDSLEVDGKLMSSDEVAMTALYCAQSASRKETERRNRELAAAQANSKSTEKPKVTPAATQDSYSGWDSCLDSLGLKGIKDVGKNFGYILAMLPDMIINMFMGRNKLSVSDNLWPLASIMIGLFTKNPLLKLILIGFGGLNLLNKVSHEQLGERIAPASHYKKYEDEPLNNRIQELAVKGNTLMATIDGSPCVITVSDRAMDAYYKGVLPLNTLANAVLSKYDEQQYGMQNDYDRKMHQAETEGKNIGLK